jgi:hypothetical protein
MHVGECRHYASTALMALRSAPILPLNNAPSSAAHVCEIVTPTSPPGGRHRERGSRSQAPDATSCRPRTSSRPSRTRSSHDPRPRRYRRVKLLVGTASPHRNVNSPPFHRTDEEVSHLFGRPQSGRPVAVHLSTSNCVYTGMPLAFTADVARVGQRASMAPRSAPNDVTISLP